MIKIAINGMGRLGRAIIRALIARESSNKSHSADSAIQIIAANDIKNWENLAYLLAHDSTHGRLDAEVKKRGDTLEIATKSAKHEVRLLNSLAPNFGSVDVVVEANGANLDTKSAEIHIKNGAKRVIIGANPSDETPIFVLGANAHTYAGEAIISNGSCTTNAIAPLFGALDAAYGVESAMLTTIHSYTSDQNLLDNARAGADLDSALGADLAQTQNAISTQNLSADPMVLDPAKLADTLRKSRSACNNIIPTSTISAALLHRVLPRLEGRLSGVSLRIPIQNVAMADVTFVLERGASVEAVNAVLAEKIAGNLAGILRFDENYGVSSDFLGEATSAVIAKDLTAMAGERTLKMMLWYDNEMGYANRILDMAERVTAF